MNLDKMKATPIADRQYRLSVSVITQLELDGTESLDRILVTMLVNDLKGEHCLQQTFEPRLGGNDWIPSKKVYDSTRVGLFTLSAERYDILSDRDFVNRVLECHEYEDGEIRRFNVLSDREMQVLREQVEPSVEFIDEMESMLENVVESLSVDDPSEWDMYDLESTLESLGITRHKVSGYWQKFIIGSGTKSADTLVGLLDDLLKDKYADRLPLMYSVDHYFTAERPPEGIDLAQDISELIDLLNAKQAAFYLDVE